MELKRDFDTECLTEAAIGDILGNQTNIVPLLDFWLEPTDYLNKSIQNNIRFDQGEASIYQTTEDSVQMRNRVERRDRRPIPDDELTPIDYLESNNASQSETETGQGDNRHHNEGTNYIVVDDDLLPSLPSTSNQSSEQKASGLSLCLLMPLYSSNLTAWLGRNNLKSH